MNNKKYGVELCTCTQTRFGRCDHCKQVAASNTRLAEIREGKYDHDFESASAAYADSGGCYCHLGHAPCGHCELIGEHWCTKCDANGFECPCGEPYERNGAGRDGEIQRMGEPVSKLSGVPSFTFQREVTIFCDGDDW